ncbi:hypothetical protein HZA57_01870 [Candidatus Poribacteria bacterium]|nr:hypothetical protein [Candidatus Poribacteria bacterium]
MDLLQIARALLEYRAMDLRLLVAETLEAPSQLANAEVPPDATREEQAAAAAIIGLLCERTGVEEPAWVRAAPALSEPRFVMYHAREMPRLRELCIAECPPALRRHGFLAPLDFLTRA